MDDITVSPNNLSSCSNCNYFKQSALFEPDSVEALTLGTCHSPQTDSERYGEPPMFAATHRYFSGKDAVILGVCGKGGRWHEINLDYLIRARLAKGKKR